PFYYSLREKLQIRQAEKCQMLGFRGSVHYDNDGDEDSMQADMELELRVLHLTSEAREVNCPSQ
ncbi:hypothetical protein STEG23_002871, partial [Scotinomys teguina]